MITPIGSTYHLFTRCFFSFWPLWLLVPSFSKQKTANVDLREKNPPKEEYTCPHLSRTREVRRVKPRFGEEKKGKIPSLKLTARALKMIVSNRSILFQWFIIQVNQVTFREGNLEIMVKLKGNIRSHAGCSKFNEVKRTGALTYHVRRFDHYNCWIFFQRIGEAVWRICVELTNPSSFARISTLRIQRVAATDLKSCS